MPAMSKSNARKRINEAVGKLDKVFSAYNPRGVQGYHLSPTDRNKIFKITSELIKMADKLK
jgi:hypothetical protein